MSWGAVIGAGAGLLGSSMASKSASKAAKSATPVPYSVSGPGGEMNVDGKNISLALGQNPFSNIFQQLGLGSLGNAGQMQNQFLNGANSEVANAYRGTFGQGLTSEIQDQLGLLRGAAAPEEARQRESLDTQLFSRGMLGTTGGAERFRALEEAIGQADAQRQLSAVNLGQQNSLNRFNAALGGTNQGMAGQLQNFNMGMGAFGGMQQLFSNLMQQANIGLGAAGGTPQGIAQYNAQAQGAPYQGAASFLQNSGAFDALGRMLGGGGGGVPMVNQPNMGGINIGAPNPSTWMPSVPGF